MNIELSRFYHTQNHLHWRRESGVAETLARNMSEINRGCRFRDFRKLWIVCGNENQPPAEPERTLEVVVFTNAAVRTLPIATPRTEREPTISRPHKRAGVIPLYLVLKHREHA